MRQLSPEMKALFRSAIFTVRPQHPCEDCGGYHLRSCPRVRRIVLIGEGPGTGNRVETEYWNQWDDSEVIYPEDVWDDEDFPEEENSERESPPGSFPAGRGGGGGEMGDDTVFLADQVRLPGEPCL